MHLPRISNLAHCSYLYILGSTGWTKIALDLTSLATEVSSDEFCKIELSGHITGYEDKIAYSDPVEDWETMILNGVTNKLKEGKNAK